MTVVYRTNGPWGTGLNSDLSPAQVDGNFWQVVQDIAAKAVQGVGISNFVIVGNMMTVVLTDHTLLGPYELPVANILFGGEWAPNHGYIANTIITHAGSTYMVLANHTSDATFDPGANNGQGQDYYGLLLHNPSLSIPSGGATGTFLRKATGVDFVYAWQTAALNDLSDATITSPVAGQTLTFMSGNWINSTPAPISVESLSDVVLFELSLGQTLVWSGANWVNATIPTKLNDLTDVNFTIGPLGGDVLTYNALAFSWDIGHVVDLPYNHLGFLISTYFLHLEYYETTTLSMGGDLQITGFGWPATAFNQFCRRVLKITNGGSYALTWPLGMKWPGGSVPIQSAGTDIYIIFTDDGGSTVYGNVVGQGYS